MKLLFANRKPRLYGNFSIESYFRTLTPYLRKEIEVFSWDAPHFSNGILPRWRSVIGLKSFLRTSDFDIVHITGDTHFLIWGISKGKRVLTIHDIGFLNNLNGIKYFLLSYFWIIGPIRKANAITCVSEATKNELLKILKNEVDIQVIPTVIDSRFQRCDKTFNEKCPTILLLGSAPNKNLHRVLEATQGLNVHLNIIAKLDEHAFELLKYQSFEVSERISFEELLEKYQTSDIVSLCSTHEGFGMPIIEGQATGRVVITSNCSSMPEVAGNGAYFVDPFSIESIRNGFIELIDNENIRNKLISEGFENVQRFRPERVANDYLKLYKSLLN
jgi:glycosyltransferase involved in cell wall biosynthesis